jgi:creatinine amidohydrolase
MDWTSQTWTELPETLAEVNCSAILPVGSVEQHGPHLGVGTDSWIAEDVCRAVSEKTGVPMLPTLPYGCSLGHSHKWPGTIALPPKVLIDTVFHIGKWAYGSGVRRLFIVNAHVTNAAPLRCALEMLRYEFQDLMVAAINTPEVSTRVRDAFFCDAADWHANAGETALLMARKPDWVRPDKIGEADDPDRTESCVFAHPVNHTSSNGVTGTPSAATVEQGNELMQWMVEDLAAIVRAGINEEIPYCAE